MKRILLNLSFAVLLFATSCEFIDDEQPQGFTPDQQDNSGNLLVINNSNQQLVLYKDQVLIKKIPASATDYLVNISNENEGTVQLDLYLYSDVAEDIYNPDPSLAYKRWMVPLANSTSIEDRATWHVGSDDTFVDVATVSFSYFGGTSYNVDVFLNDRSGAKIMSLMPGQQYKKVGIDFGNYSLHYKYWYSNPDDNQAIDESKTVWVEQELINGDEVKIWMVLNENRKEVTYIVPHNGVDTQKKSWYGNIKVTNLHNQPVIIKAGDKLIESVCYLDNGSKNNLSSLANNGSQTYVMPVLDQETFEEIYILSARDLEGRFIEDITLTVKPDKTVEWIIDGEADSDTTDVPVVIETPIE